MKALRRASMVAASVLAMVLMLAAPALGAGSGSGGGGGGGNGGSSGSGGGETSGSVYSDLDIILRATNGTPILKAYEVPPTSESTSATTEYCAQPVSYQPIPGVASTTNPVDGRTVWVVPLQGEWLTNPPDPLPVEAISACDPQPQDAMFVSEVDLERLNLARTSDEVLAQKLNDVTLKLQSGNDISLESTGRISIDGVPIDAAPENAAIYQSLMNTGTIPGLPSSMAGPPAEIGPAPTSPDSNSQFDALELAAMTIGAAASKSTPLSIDAVEYYNQVIGFPPAPNSSGTPYVSPWGLTFVTSTNPQNGQPMTGTQQYVDYSGFSYNRSETFKGSVTWLDTSTLTWKVSKITDVVPFTNLSSYPEIGDHTLYGVTAFAQLADDVRALCNFIPDNTYIPGFTMDVPGVDSTAAQEKAITDPAVDLGVLPTNVIETSPFTVTSQLLNPFGGSLIANARLRITVHAPQALAAGDVTATATDGESVPFSVDGGDLTGWWGPASGFPVSPGYNTSATFDVTFAEGAPTGLYKVTLDLISVDDPSQVLAQDTGTLTVLPNQTTVLWGEGVPTLATQGDWVTLPLQVYAPAPGSAQLDLTVTGPGDPESAATLPLAAGDVTLYASNGSAMVAMPFSVNDQGQLVGTWPLSSLAAGYTPVLWYLTVSTDAPLGNYAFGVSLQGGNTLDSIVVPFVAPASHGQQPTDAGEKTITSAAATTFTVSESDSFTVTTAGSPTPTLSVVGTLPLGVTFTDNGDGTATFAGTPAAGSDGSYPITVYAQYGTTIDSQTFTLTVAPQSTTPITPTPTPTSTTTSGGYWLAASDGGVFSFGGAGFYGSMGAKALNQPIVAMAATPDDQGYWLVASDGGVFAFGDAHYYGSMGDQHLNQPIVSMAATSDGKGYWLVASDGGVFAFGDAGFYGSQGSQHLNAPVVSMAATSDGQGYWLVASDGGVFTHGDASFHGSEGGRHLNRHIVAMAASHDGSGYRLVAADGGVFAFGGASFSGSMGGTHLNASVVCMATAA